MLYQTEKLTMRRTPSLTNLNRRNVWKPSVLKVVVTSFFAGGYEMKKFSIALVLLILFICCNVFAQEPYVFGANFISDVTSRHAPLTANFEDLSSEDVISWSWDFGDGGTSTDQNPRYVYISSGIYTVSLTVSNGFDTDTMTRVEYIIVEEPTCLVSSLDMYDSHEIDVSGDYAYVASGNAGLEVVDVSNPDMPYLTGSVDLGAFVRGISVSGDYAYLVGRLDQGFGFHVVDISNPYNPFGVTSLNTSNNAQGIGIYGSYAYVATTARRLEVFDIVCCQTNPDTQPKKLIDTFSNC
jgi:PKD repeat protein